jgi:hypothetical protein
MKSTILKVFVCTAALLSCKMFMVFLFNRQLQVIQNIQKMLLSNLDWRVIQRQAEFQG